MLRILKNDLNLRTNIISQDAKKLEDELANITSDLEKLESCCTGLMSVDNMKNNLHNNLKQVIDRLKAEALINIKIYLDEKEYEKENFVQKVDINPRDSLLGELGEDNILPDFITDRLKDELGNITNSTIEFSSANEAKNFIIKAVSWSKTRADNCLQIGSQHTANIIQQHQQELVKFLESETKNIIKKAFPLLNKSFDLELSFPPHPSINNQIALGDFQVCSATRQITEYKTEKYRPWYFLWLIELKRKVPITKTESYYTVSLEDLVEEINNSTETSINQINTEISQYLDQEFQPQVDNYVAELYTYLSEYKNSLLQIKQTRELSLAEKNTWIEQLNALVSKADQKLTETDRCSEQAKQYL